MMVVRLTADGALEVVSRQDSNVYPVRYSYRRAMESRHMRQTQVGLGQTTNMRTNQQELYTCGVPMDSGHI